MTVVAGVVRVIPVEVTIGRCGICANWDSIISEDDDEAGLIRLGAVEMIRRGRIADDDPPSGGLCNSS